MTNSADVIVLSSSPILLPQTPSKTADGFERTFGISPRIETPPSLPSPSELLSLPSRSRFFPQPKVTDDTPKTKRRAMKKTVTSDSKDKDASIKLRQRTKKAMKEPKSSGLGDIEPDSLDSRDNVAKKATVPPKSRPRKSTKAVKSKESGNMTLAGKVTKTSSEPQAKKSSKTGKKTAETKLSPGDLPEQSGSKASSAREKDEELYLDKALRRRVDWTPPKETATGETLVVKSDDQLDKSPPKSTTSGLGKLLSDYNYSGSSSETREIPSNPIGGGMTKRRRIELVDPQVYPRTDKVLLNDESSVQEEDSTSSGSKPKKKPKSKKRFTTLTARMTAQYAANDAEDDLMDDIIPDIGKAKSRRGKAKSADKDPIFTVLSPEAAAKSLENQDLMFGTCSQLEREDSPQTLREMQQAIRESEGFDPREGEQNTVSDVVSRRSGTRNLWSVASRDTEGTLVQAEPLDMIDLTGAAGALKKKDNTTAIANPRTSATGQEDDWLDLDSEKLDSSSKQKSQPEKRSKSAAQPKPAASPEPVASGRDIQANVASSQRAGSQQPSMPHYSGFTDAELSSQVASFGFKSVRGRKKMIELLQKCWESKQGISAPAISSQKQHTPAPAQTTSETKTAKPKGKAKSKQSTTVSTPKKSTQRVSKAGKNAQPSFMDVEEIQDSEEEIFLSPSQVQKRYTEIFSNTTSSTVEPSLEILTKQSQPPSPANRETSTIKSSRAAKKVTSSVASKADNTDPSKRNSLLDLSIQITKAVRHQSQSSHPSTHAGRILPTWQEKIVMYDPIILEDLTTWLNVEGLGMVGEDREVNTGIVRKWCENRGICCCWRKNASW